ncbi:MAG: hypothetical protein IPN85_02955 [Flavobacteriales bacterium]|nr:hypothetical protein [Flavobacteriales bacterium]MBL0034204.1 hypothetical protein [Flavobacteriales bacterium]
MQRISHTILHIASALLPQFLAAQQVQWLTASPNDWVLNPTTPVDVLCARDPDHVYVAQLDHIAYTYNEPMGGVTLTRQAADGTVLWSVSLGDTVQVESIASDEDGTVVLGGRYFNRLLVDGSPVLSVPGGHVAEGSFLCAWDANGQLLWQQDVSGGTFDDVSVASLALDVQGRFWAALSTFFSAEIVRLETDGSQVESRSLVDSKMIGSISFDPWGGLYVAGAAESPDITINGTVFPVAENYAFFVTRMNAAGYAQWVSTAEDITFQKPRVVADTSGHAYLAGSYFEPLTWGTIPFTDPLWSTGLFLTRLDSLGSFEWGVQTPGAWGSGQFILAHGNALGVDGDGNAFVLGNVNGSIDWGNGVVTGSGTIADKSIALLRFDPVGLPNWAQQGGSTFSDMMYDLAVATDGVTHFVGVTSDPFTLGPYTVDPVNARGTVVARVDPGLSTAVAEAPGTSDLIACPSVFTSTFRLLSATFPNDPSTTVTLIDGAGRVVERSEGLNAELGQGLANGIYKVLVQGEGRSRGTRVVKE